jgi:hypothetical protein
MLGEESFQPRQVPAVSIYDGEGVVEMRMIVDYRIVQKRGDQVGQHLSVTGGQVGQAPRRFRLTSCVPMVVGPGFNEEARQVATHTIGPMPVAG